MLQIPSGSNFHNIYLHTYLYTSAKIFKLKILLILFAYATPKNL